MGCAGPSARINKVASTMANLQKERKFDDLGKASAAISAADLSPSALQKYSDETLETLYKTLWKAVFFSPDNESFADRMELAFNEKVSRKKYTEGNVQDMAWAFREARAFNKALNMQKRFPAIVLPPIPMTIVPSGASPTALWQVYALSDDGAKAEIKSLPLGKGAAVVVAMWPGCRVTARAMKDIMADPVLGPLFSANAVMLTRRFDSDGVEEMKKKLGFPAVYIARKSVDFPGVEFQRSPSFFFLKDGKVLYQFAYWSECQVALGKVRAGLKAVGLFSNAETTEPLCPVQP